MSVTKWTYQKRNSKGEHSRMTPTTGALGHREESMMHPVAGGPPRGIYHVMYRGQKSGPF
jgi:hypothetical protein